MIQAYGYDDNAMPSGMGLTRDDLDKDFPENPVLVGHVSMHGAVLNSARDEEVEHHGGHQNASRRHHRPEARRKRAGGPCHGNGLPADLRVTAQADARTGSRVVARRADALRPGGHHDGPRRVDACR